MKKLILTILLFLVSCGYSYKYDKSLDSIENKNIDSLKIVSYQNPKETINVDKFIEKYNDSLKLIKKEKSDSMLIERKQLDKNLKKIKTQKFKLDSLIAKRK